MQKREWKLIDKKTWGPGAWQDEFDKMQWTDNATGLPCLIVRADLTGAWCGYVGVTRSHPFYGIHYDIASDLGGLEAHGGLTFAGHCTDSSVKQWKLAKAYIVKGQEEARQFPTGDVARYTARWGRSIDKYEDWREQCAEVGICHIPDPGEAEKVWWLGFDCSHFNDFSPAMEARHRELGIGRLREGLFPELPPLLLAPGEDDPFKAVYRDMLYAQTEVTQLAAQIKSADTWRNQLRRAGAFVNTWRRAFRSWSFVRDVTSGKLEREARARLAKYNTITDTETDDE